VSRRNQKEAKPPRSKLSWKPRLQIAPAGEAKINTWINTSGRLITRDDQIKTERSGARTKDTTQNKDPATLNGAETQAAAGLGESKAGK
jgi:hypothetical protein